MKNTALVLILACTATVAGAVDIPVAARDYVEARIPQWRADPVLIAAVLAQNAAHASLTEAAILELDTKWRAEVGQSEQPTIRPVLTNEAAQVLRAIEHDAGGTVAEVFVMDNRGLNVAVADVTSDYWQGDEEKFTATYPVGADAIHVGEVDFDESSQLFEIQVSFTFTDASGAPIGAMTVALNAEALD
ncbi:MAG: hypothetical protein K0B00_10060 [Rhodobacteraceae bacterium]|nr:hypothetical protein [Paracoccaceae bacterium]